MFQFFKKSIHKKESEMPLSDYKKQYLREKTTESIESLFKQLKWSKVWVPFNVSLMDESDGQEGARLTPDVLRKGDKFFYPCFLTLHDIHKDYYDRFSWLQIPFTDCLFTAESIGKFPVRGIVLDAFSDPVEIDKGSFEAIRQSQ